MKVRAIRISDEAWEELRSVKGSMKWEEFVRVLLLRYRAGEEGAGSQNGKTEVVIPKEPGDMPDTFYGRATKSIEHSPTCKCLLCS